MGCCLGYILQFILVKVNHFATAGCKNPICLIVSTVCSCCSCTSFIIVSSVFLALSGDNPQSSDTILYHYCDYSPKLALGLEMIVFAILPVGVSLLIADGCRTTKKKPEEMEPKEFNFTFLRIVNQAVNEIALILTMIAFIRNTMWGLALFIVFLVPQLVWVVFISCVSKNKLAHMEVYINIFKKSTDRIDFCTCLLIIPIIFLSPIFSFLFSSLAMMDLWQVEDNNPRQYFYVNINLLLRVVFLIPFGGMFLAFTLFEDIEYFFIVGFFSFWVFTLGNIVFPFVETCRKKGCKRRYVLATPINTLFTKEEVDTFYTKELDQISQEKQPQKKEK